jgi:hypothetical protein
VKNRFQSLPFKCNLQRYIEGDIADVATQGRYAFNPAPLQKKDVEDHSYFVYTEVLPGYTALACNWLISANIAMVGAVQVESS